MKTYVAYAGSYLPMRMSQKNQIKRGNPSLNHVVRIFVITTKTSSLRHNSIKRQAELYGFNFDFIFNFDVDDLGCFDLTKISNSLPKSTVSCLCKHIYAQKMLLASDCEMALVLEDDAILRRSFMDTVEQIVQKMISRNDSWNVFLGGSDNRVDFSQWGSRREILMPGELTTAEAYLYNRTAAEKRLAWLASNKVTVAADHLLTQLNSGLGISSYRLVKPVVSQGSITGLFRTLLDGSRSKKPLWYLRVRHFLNAFRKQIYPRNVRYLQLLAKDYFDN